MNRQCGHGGDRDCGVFGVSVPVVFVFVSGVVLGLSEGARGVLDSGLAPQEEMQKE